MKQTSTFNAREAAAYLGVSVRQIWGMAKSGELRGSKSGSGLAKAPWRFEFDDLRVHQTTQDGFATINVAAKQVGALPNTVYSWVSSGALAVKVVHGVKLVRPSDVAELRLR